MNSKSGLYPEIFRSALGKHIHIPIRSENMKNLSNFFVDNNQLGLLKNPDWQVIYGRRGTGKTLLLKVLSEQMESTFEKQRILTLLISAQDCLVSPIGKVVNDKTKALGYFQTFLERLTDKLCKKVDNFLGKPSLLDHLIGGRSRVTDKIQDITIELLELARVGRPVSAYSDWKHESDSSTISTKEESRRMGGDAKASSEAISFSAHGGMDSAGNTIKKDSNTRHEEDLRVPRFALVREKILELLDILEIKHLNILIDEWQTLDSSGVTGIQPEFAEYLKRTFSGANNISVKIAANRYQSRFNNRGKSSDYRGLEVGADIFEATNLDHQSGDIVQDRKFFASLIFKRLSHCEPKLSMFDPSETGEPDEQFVFSIFKDQRAFDELIKGSFGVPRDFLLIFNNIAKFSDYCTQPVWETTSIQKYVRENVAILEEETDPTSEADQLLSKCVKHIVDATGSRVFLIDRDDRHTLNGAVEELIEKRLIEQLSKAELSGEVTNKYDAFLAHYGLWVSWRKQIESLGSPTYIEMPRITLTNCKEFLVDASIIDNTIVTCPHCGDRFSIHAKSYVVKGLCPSCFEKI